jgi:hypothetical protein
MKKSEQIAPKENSLEKTLKAEPGSPMSAKPNSANRFGSLVIRDRLVVQVGIEAQIRSGGMSVAPNAPRPLPF